MYSLLLLHFLLLVDRELPTTRKLRFRRFASLLAHKGIVGHPNKSIRA